MTVLGLGLPLHPESFSNITGWPEPNGVTGSDGSLSSLPNNDKRCLPSVTWSYVLLFLVHTPYFMTHQSQCFFQL